MNWALWHCIKCGECCRHMVGRKFGAAITPLEKKRLTILADRKSVNAHFAPLTSDGFKVTLWQFVQDICPFLDKKTNRCSIYEWRPLLCKMYPLHARGIAKCPSLDAVQKRGFRVAWPPSLLDSGETYVSEVIPHIHRAVKRYNLAAGKWELNMPFQVSSSLMNVVL